MDALAGAATRALWLDRLDPPIRARPPLATDLDVDVAIIGGGFSGLWTAYYLAKADPSIRVAILERHFCGFGASGRNGGWAVGELAGSFDWYAQRSSIDSARRLVREVQAAVDEIGRVATAERIDCHFAKDGAVRLARNEPQWRRQQAEVDESRRHGMTNDDLRLLSASEASKHVVATGVRGGLFFAHCAALDPARLVRGLAEAAERAGVQIFEQTKVEAVDAHGFAGGEADSNVGSKAPRRQRVQTPGGVVRADAVVRAAEAYTRDLPGLRRSLLPVYSLMIATEPLSKGHLDAIGMTARPTFADDRAHVIYGQRTADDRLAFGAPGVPYLFGSRISEANGNRMDSHREIHRILLDLFPSLADVAITHRWGGVLAIPRNWIPGLNFDPATGVGQLGGYVGEGVAAANLAGRTMADLILGQQTERTTLPWVGATARNWEPEPLRFLGVRVSRWLLGRADRVEAQNREARFASGLARMLREGVK